MHRDKQTSFGHHFTHSNLNDTASETCSATQRNEQHAAVYTDKYSCCLCRASFIAPHGLQVNQCRKHNSVHYGILHNSNKTQEQTSSLLFHTAATMTLLPPRSSRIWERSKCTTCLMSHSRKFIRALWHHWWRHHVIIVLATLALNIS